MGAGRLPPFSHYAMPCQQHHLKKVNTQRSNSGHLPPLKSMAMPLSPPHKPGAMRLIQILIPLLAASLLSSLLTYALVYRHEHQSPKGALHFSHGLGGFGRGSILDLPGVNSHLLNRKAGGKSQSGVAAENEDDVEWGTIDKYEPRKAAQPPKLLAKPSERKQQLQKLAALAAAGGTTASSGAAAVAGSSKKKLHIAIVNHAPYHLEVVAGLIHVFKSLPCTLVWYQVGHGGPNAPHSPLDMLKDQGFLDLVGNDMPPLRPMGEVKDEIDFAVFVSPEYFLEQTKVSVTCLCS